MSLVDFMQKLQEQDDSGVIYSTPPEPSIKVIPPSAPTSIKVIPPESITELKQPVKIKLKINKKSINVNNNMINQQPQTQQTPSIEQKVAPVEVAVNNQSQIQQPVQPVEPTRQIEPSVNNQTAPVIEERKLTEEEEIMQLFIKSGTESSKKEIWVSCYKQAKASRKRNPVTDRMKIGKFTITPDNKVLILPDYDVVGKDPDDILKDKWF